MKRFISYAFVLAIVLSCGAAPRRGKNQTAQPKTPKVVTTELQETYDRLATLTEGMWSGYLLPKAVAVYGKERARDCNYAVVLISPKPDASQVVRFPQVVTLGLWATTKGGTLHLIRVSENHGWAIRRETKEAAWRVSSVTINGPSNEISPAFATIQDVKPLLSLLDIDDKKIEVSLGPMFKME